MSDLDKRELYNILRNLNPNDANSESSKKIRELYNILRKLNPNATEKELIGKIEKETGDDYPTIIKALRANGLPKDQRGDTTTTPER